MPTLLAKEKVDLEAPDDRPKEFIPIIYEGAKDMSFGFVNANKKPILRGPMVSSIVTSFHYSTIWEELDYLDV